ncbi:DNA repair protein RadA [Acetobacter orientalis]|uniref:DNA repair protein RadA n=1 Tax=Acetobacter orientalis TaxID=146474 RepID=A0A2Z5ZFW4_9PROT|nr:DNA repair protein RadA [Acetobacter orientalis]
MAKKPFRQFVCSHCGAVYPKWVGQCEACGEWNTLEEEAVEPLAASSARGGAAHKGRRVKLEGLEGIAKPPPRIETGIVELDRVLGGGLVPASAVLVGVTPVLVNQRFCYRPLANWPVKASVFFIYQVKKPLIRYACARYVWELVKHG